MTTPAIDPPARTWFVTGAGRGIGLAVVEAALAAGDRVVGTVRRPGTLDGLVEQDSGRIHEVVVDVRDRAGVTEAVDEAAALLGRIDVVVNNAGYGLVGAAEEVTEAEAREIVDTNFFGALWVTQAALPYLRRQGGGDIVQISTVGGVGAMALFGMYNASKWALEGFSEALANEVRGFGVRVTIAQLDGFASDWSWASMRFAHPSPDYDDVRTSTLGSADVPWDPAGKDESDEAPPSVAAAAIVDHVRSGDDRLRLLVGTNSPVFVSMALDGRRRDYARDERFRWPTAVDDPDGS